MKRMFDFVVALVLLIILSPLMLFLIIMIRIKIGTPILFKQKRPGLYEKPFYLYKFRTMTNDTDQTGEVLPDYLRLLDFGKTLRKYSLDELPQLFNVLKGELSLVGPRPLLMEYLPLYNAEQAKRHLAKPGITGWAQINGRNKITWEEKFDLDVWYVLNQTFLLDIKILWLTIVKVVRHEDINQTEDEPMDSFTGTPTKEQNRA